MERVRMLLYEAIKNSCTNSRVCSVVMTICAVWPQCLVATRFSAIQKILQYYVSISLDHDKALKRFVKMCCGWDLIDRKPDELVSKLFEQAKSLFKIKQEGHQDEFAKISWEMQVAFTLVCMKEGWTWTSNSMLPVFLWPVLGAWAGQTESFGDHFIQLVIDLLGICLSIYMEKVDPANHAYILGNLKSLVSQMTVPLKIRESALRSVLRLSNRSSSPSDAIQSMMQHRDAFSEDTLNLLQEFAS